MIVRTNEGILAEQIELFKSIVTTCLMAIFGEMLGVDWRKAVESLADELCKGALPKRSENESK